MPQVPDAHQSVRPPRTLLLAALAALLVLVGVWFAVTWAVDNGGDDCPAGPRNQAESRCR